MQSMVTSIIRSRDRGSGHYGWLQAKYSFSFGQYYNAQRIHFGKLRVLNDDIIEANRGFALHGHANMEIITIPLKGAIKHEDSTGAKGIIRPGEVQIMSAGLGIEHSEKNAIKNDDTQLFQIWIFPKTQNTTPQYHQQSFNEQLRQNQWQYIVSNKHQAALPINQDAVLSLAHLDDNKTLDYTLNYEGNGLYLMVIDGTILINGEQLGRRDAIEITDFETISLEARKAAKLLAIEVPMGL